MRTFHIRRFNRTLHCERATEEQFRQHERIKTALSIVTRKKQMSAASEIDLFFFSKRPLEDIVFRFDVLLHLSGTL